MSACVCVSGEAVGPALPPPPHTPPAQIALTPGAVVFCQHEPNFRNLIISQPFGLCVLLSSCLTGTPHLHIHHGHVHLQVAGRRPERLQEGVPHPYGESNGSTSPCMPAPAAEQRTATTRGRKCCIATPSPTRFHVSALRPLSAQLGLDAAGKTTILYRLKLGDKVYVPSAFRRQRWCASWVACWHSLLYPHLRTGRASPPSASTLSMWSTRTST